MRKTVNYIKLDSIVDKYMIKGVSLMDMQRFIEKLKIPKEKIMIYQDIPQQSENMQEPLHIVKYVSSIKRRTSRFDTGNDCYIVTNEKNLELFKKTCNDIFYSNDDASIPQEILLMFYVHDIDWLATAIFNDKILKEEFFNFIRSRAKLVLESNHDMFYD